MKVSKQGQIKWKQIDYLTLGRAVANFNKKRNMLEMEEIKSYLPDELNYKEVKQGITTRNELNRVLKSLRRFMVAGAEDLYVTQAGEEITKWERNELSIQSRIARRRLNEELKQLNLPLDTGFSRIQMGTQRENELKAQLKNLDTIETKRGYEFQRLSNRIKKIGTSDYTMKMSIVYQENFMNELEKLKDNHNEFLKVYEYFKNIQNPITFFNTAQKSRALLDFFEWYEKPEFYADFNSIEELANDILNEYKDGE